MGDSIFPGGRSPFRAGFLIVALFIGGVWVNVPTTEVGDDGVTISRGRRNESGRTEPSSCSFRLKDPTGKWSPRHPSSPYYGLIGRGTPVRVQVEMTAGVVVDRWYGEVATWQPKWSKKGAESAYVDVECGGILRRLGQGASPLRSPLYRGITDIGSNLVAYWPMEDGQDATRFTPAVGARAMTFTGKPTLSSYAGFAASEQLPSIGKATMLGRVSSAATGFGQVRWMMRVPSSIPDNTVLLRVRSSGSLGWADVVYTAPAAPPTGASGQLLLNVYNGDGTLNDTMISGTFLNGLNVRGSLEIQQVGADLEIDLNAYEVGATTTYSAGSLPFTGLTLGAITSVEINPNGVDTGDTVIGHVSVEKALTGLLAVSQDILTGHLGEPAMDRIARLCAENGVTYANYLSTGSEPMGAQGAQTFVDLLDECAATDGGILYEPRSTTELSYRSLQATYSQTPLSIAYVENMLKPFEPVEDDESTRNQITVTRAGGSSATVQETTGPLGSAAAGVYDENVTLSLAADDDALAQAYWRLHLGTVDEARWPVIGVDLADPRILANTSLRDSLLNIGLLSLIRITDVPAWLPPFDVVQLVQGYREVITPLSYRLDFNCTPGRPYNIVKWSGSHRWSGQGTTAPTLTATQTTFTVTTPGKVLWTHADGDYDVVIGGEQMTVTDVVNGKDFTVIRSVNGVVKSHTAGALVQLASPAYWAL